MESRFLQRRISVLSKSGWRIVTSRTRELFANWKELQHTGVCLRNIHLNTKLLTLLTHYIASRCSLTTSLRPLRGFAISFARASPLKSDGCCVVWCCVVLCGLVLCGVVLCGVVWLQIIMRFVCFIIFILCLIQYCVRIGVLVMTNQLQYMFDVLL
jgi:hypothetical protein